MKTYKVIVLETRRYEIVVDVENKADMFDSVKEAYLEDDYQFMDSDWSIEGYKEVKNDSN